MVTTSRIEWTECQRLLRVVSNLTHTRGVSSCFSHMAADVEDETYYPGTMAGVAAAQAGLTRVFERYVDKHYHLRSTPVPRRLTGRFVLADGGVNRVYRTQRGARVAATRRGLHYSAITPQQEPLDKWIDRSIAPVDEQLTLESAWRDAQDAVSDYAGVPDRYNQRGRRWFDAPSQDERRAAAVAAIINAAKAEG